ncbi:hypothetical protein [Gimesia sp.]|uniref:hypothetical protein n=1 Tax=Gimesia sp. TaxID=2024833 RepID=UPI003A944F0F
MAKCDQGYLCVICGEEVEHIEDSGLYLRYIIGEVQAEELQAQPEHHIRCNPVLAQFIIDKDFEAVSVDGPFDKRELDPEEVRLRESLVTRGWLRLQEVNNKQLSISEFPLD